LLKEAAAKKKPQVVFAITICWFYNGLSSVETLKHVKKKSSLATEDG
jgi:hypothetical protein